MRQLIDAPRLRQFMRALGREATSPGHVLFTGGATAVIEGWRHSTIDIDIKLVPDQDALLRAVPALKESLNINIELASPDDFIPVRENWMETSPFVAQEGPLTFHHFDPHAQALSKIERGHAQDLEDVHEMLARGLVTKERLQAYFEAITPRLYRYPALDAASFARAVAAITA